jgi:hypothetical protein
MRNIALLGAAALALSVGCGGGGKADRCGELWKDALAAVKKLGNVPVVLDKDTFLRRCRILETRAPDCLDEANRDELRCRQASAAAEDEVDPPRHFDLGWKPLTILGDRVSVKVPDGWESDGGIRSMHYYTPAPAPYKYASLAIEALCADEGCAPHTAAEWKAEAEGLLQSDRGVNKSVRKDEALGEAGWIIVTEIPTEPRTRGIVDAVHWQEGGQVLYRCRAELDRSLFANLDEFEAACRSLTATSFAKL